MTKLVGPSLRQGFFLVAWVVGAVLLIAMPFLYQKTAHTKTARTPTTVAEPAYVVVLRADTKKLHLHFEVRCTPGYFSEGDAFYGLAWPESAGTEPPEFPGGPYPVWAVEGASQAEVVALLDRIIQGPPSFPARKICLRLSGARK